MTFNSRPSNKSQNNSEFKESPLKSHFKKHFQAPLVSAFEIKGIKNIKKPVRFPKIMKRSVKSKMLDIHKNFIKY